MATVSEPTTGTYARTDWPVSRILAAVGAAIGLIMAVLLLAGSLMGVGIANLDQNLAFNAGMLGAAGLVGAFGIVHLVLALLCVGSTWAMPNNMRLHGGLLVVWGIIGLFLGFGFWIGAVLVLVGGVLGVARTPTTGYMGRRPVA